MSNALTRHVEEGQGLLSSTLVRGDLSLLSVSEKADLGLTIKVVTDQLATRAEEVRQHLITEVKEHGEVNASGKTWTLATESGEVAVTARESVKIDEGRLRTLLQEKGIPSARVYPTTSLTVVPPKGKEVTVEVYDCIVAALAEKFPGFKVNQVQSLNEKAVEGLAALDMISADELVGVTNSRVTDSLSLKPNDDLVSDLVG